jgi:CDP-diacylglycerol--serine O-phosphatidyltransferase
MAGFVKAGWFIGAKGYNLGGLKGLGKAVDEGSLPLGSVTLFGDKGGWGEVHVLSFVFLAWAAMMVSKTLKVSRLGVSKECGF